MTDISSFLSDKSNIEDSIKKIQSNANLYQKKTMIEEHTINTKYDQIITSKKEMQSLQSLSSDNTFFGNMDDVYQRAKIAYRKNLPLISKELSDKVPTVPGSLILIGGMTGVGKSTTTANIIRKLWKEGKKVLIITNEETLETVVNRIAFIEANLDYNEFRKDDFSPTPEQEQIIVDVGNEVVKFVTVKDKPVESCKLEGVKAILDDAKKKQTYDVIILDYFQAVSESIQNKGRVEILYELRDYLKDFCREEAPPVILFAQLIPLEAKETDRNMEVRIKWVKGLMEAATSALEIVKEPGIPVTRFVVTKSRWGFTGKDIYYKYNKGEFTPITKNERDEIGRQIQISSCFQNLDI
jgi:replicative DNA helicase